MWKGDGGRRKKDGTTRNEGEKEKEKPVQGQRRGGHDEEIELARQPIITPSTSRIDSSAVLVPFVTLFFACPLYFQILAPPHFIPNTFLLLCNQKASHQKHSFPGEREKLR